MRKKTKINPLFVVFHSVLFYFAKRERFPCSRIGRQVVSYQENRKAKSSKPDV